MRKAGCSMIFSEFSSKIFAASTVAALVLAGTFAIKNYSLRADISYARLAHADDMRRVSDENAALLTAEIKRANEVTTKLDELNSTLEKERHDAKTSNDELRAKYASERRLRLNGATCVVPRGNGVDNKEPSASTVADGEIEYSPELRQAVFDTRAMILEDRAKIEGLQSYIQITCRK